MRARSANSPQSRRSLGDLIRDDPLSTIVTVSIDLVSAIVATGVAIFWIVNRQPEYPPLWTIGLYPLILVGGIFGLRKTYRRGLNRRFLDEVGKVMTGCTVAAMILLCSMLLSGLDDRPGAAVTKLWVSAIFWVPWDASSGTSPSAACAGTVISWLPR